MDAGVFEKRILARSDAGFTPIFKVVEIYPTPVIASAAQQSRKPEATLKIAGRFAPRNDNSANLNGA
jgi:hypothetical protein